jgi:asparagine synthase (glutamine-hydrolysing)
MCGIFGFNFEDSQLLRKGLAKMAHRGPDATGTYLDKSVNLGHNRLSILDLSPAGKQPMSNENGDIWITFNGEIYNYVDIKKSLKKNHNFSSSTDTEILLHLYEEKGVHMVKDLQGMFAFCIYDSKNKILLLARDRVGKKPLYYYLKDKKFIFASEIKAILEDSSVKKQVNRQAIPYFLAFRANTTYETMFKGIFKLPPATIGLYDLKDNSFKIKRYWDININISNESEQESLEKFYSLIEDSVRCRLVSDVPYGAYLSGGVDSGTIVSLMSKFSKQPVKTFSVGFSEENESELSAAKVLSQAIGTDHHELFIDRKSIKHLPKIVYHLDEPMSDPTSIPTYLLSEYAKKFCTVILTGEGADEILAGYPQYKFMKMHEKFIAKTPNFLKNSIIWSAKHSPKFLLDKGFKFASSLGEKGIERFSNFIKSENYSQQYLQQVSIFNDEEQTELLKNKIELKDNFKTYFDNKNNIVSNCQILDFKNPMVEDLLMKVDKNAMAFSIEGRVPFLDYRLVEFAFNLNPELKLKGLSKDKYILRKTCQVKKLIPIETLKRKKRHFFVPIDNWLSEELSNLKETLFSRQYLEKQSIFNPDYIQKIQNNLDKSKLFYSRQLWSLINFQIWHKEFIENEKVII